ncbi:MAG: 50S ribosomal protein L2 [Candidatus ainarchaeum sp.]|nr:50S ribosomal protein L2 [Candidatus ainarchaeum sp.]
MARRLHQQRRGKGSPKYRANKSGVKAKYDIRKTDDCKAEVVGIISNTGKTAPVSEIVLENGRKMYVPAVEGAYVSQRLEVGPSARPEIGNIMPIGNVPLGFVVSNIESIPEDGGSFMRASGTFGIIIGKDEKGVYVKLRSKAKKIIRPDCLCTIGRVAGGGRKEKPLYKAGNNFYLMRAKGGRVWPSTRGYAMNAADHPHGGSGHNSSGRKKNVSKKFSTPGQKVGSVGASRSGRKKK